VNKKSTILIRENGRPLNKDAAYSKQNDNNETVRSEQAATVQESEDQPEYQPLKSVKQNYLNGKTRFHKLKPILLAVCSALMIGSVLGFIMLRTFGGIETEQVNQTTNQIPAVSDDSDEQQEDNNGQAGDTSFVLEPVDLFVLQAGVFSDQSNADQWQQTYESSGVSTLMWERDNQIFLLASPAATKQHGNEMADGIEELDIYVKEWSVPEREISGTQEEKEWLESFQEQWNRSLTTWEEEDVLNASEWQSIVENAPESERFQTLIEAVADMTQSEGMEAGQQLIHLLYVYDQATQ